MAITRPRSVASPGVVSGQCETFEAITRHTTFKFCLTPTAEQQQLLERHAGAYRFAFNQCLPIVKSVLDQARPTGVRSIASQRRPSRWPVADLEDGGWRNRCRERREVLEIVDVQQPGWRATIITSPMCAVTSFIKCRTGSSRRTTGWSSKT